MLFTDFELDYDKTSENEFLSGKLKNFVQSNFYQMLPQMLCYNVHAGDKVNLQNLLYASMADGMLGYWNNNTSFEREELISFLQFKYKKVFKKEISKPVVNHVLVQLENVENQDTQQMYKGIEAVMKLLFDNVNIKYYIKKVNGVKVFCIKKKQY